MGPSRIKLEPQASIFLKKPKKELENGENEKIRKNGATWNIDEQCFGQLHGMAMACRGWDRIKDLDGI